MIGKTKNRKDKDKEERQEGQKIGKTKIRKKDR